MAKTKKASPKKALTKKASAKKTTPKKAIIKNTKKPAPPKAVKKNTPSKKKSEDIILQQTFMDSLAKLEKYWAKKVNTLSKELNALVAKEKKALSAKNSNHANQVKKHQQLAIAVNAKRDELAQATLASDKFSTLSKKIAQFEKEWLQQLNQHTDNFHEEENSPADHGAYTHKTTHQSKQKTYQPKWDATQETEEEVTDDLEDIFMPQDDLSEFEVIEDFSATHDEDMYDEDES